MKSYQDVLGREWEIIVNIATIKRVRDIGKIDLLSVASGHEALTLANDPIKMADILWGICKPQADERGISCDSFCEGLMGDSFNIAIEAVLTELVDFFPDARIRDMMKSQMSVSSQIIQSAFENVSEKLNSNALHKEIEANLNAHFGMTSTSVPES